MKLILLLPCCLLVACSTIDSTRDLDQQQIATLTRQIYHIKPHCKPIPPVAKKTGQT